jgi:hypothetical protein
VTAGYMSRATKNSVVASSWEFRVVRKIGESRFCRGVANEGNVTEHGGSLCDHRVLGEGACTTNMTVILDGMQFEQWAGMKR